MGSKCEKAKLALGLNFCVLVPRTLDDSPPAATEASGRLSVAALFSPVNWEMGSSRPTTPVPPSLNGLNLSRSGSNSCEGEAFVLESVVHFGM